MNQSKYLKCSPSTPKRCRLGTSKNIIQLSQASGKDKTYNNISKHLQIKDNCYSPPLPCNQVEYLCESESNRSIVNDIPCSPGVLETCTLFDNIANWKSFVDSKTSKEDSASISITDDAFKENFYSRNESNNKNQCNFDVNINFKKDIENSFNAINQSICNNAHFETNDSFLLDIRESGFIDDKFQISQLVSINNQFDSFYGLPLITKGLFKSYRNIEKFYGKFCTYLSLFF